MSLLWARQQVMLARTRAWLDWVAAVEVERVRFGFEAEGIAVGTIDRI